LKTAFFLLFCILTGVPVLCNEAQGNDDISIRMVSDLFPSATRTVPVDSPAPHVVVFEGREVLGYVYYTDRVKPIPAYSGFPIRSLVSLKAGGEIHKVKIVQHQEPILVIGVNDRILAAFIDQYSGLSAKQRIRLTGADQPNSVDGISGATITAMVLNHSITQSAKVILEAHENAAATIGVETDAGFESMPLWFETWWGKKFELAFLILGLTLLVLVLLFQDWVVVHSRLFNALRLGYLFYTVFFIGYYCLGQLSIINVVTFVRLLAADFTWDTLLLDPVIFILWGFVALSILLWGRGVFCGWLCPFGAIQELMQKLSRALGIRQREFPQVLHERLLALKYVILIALVGLSLNTIALAAPFFEIEPFKTTISLRFQREWYFVAYAGGLIAISLVITKFYCRYICPLGAVLSFSTHFKIFNWLRRRSECGSVCHTCGNDCSVGAINNKGEINELECHYCLECQATYWDEHKCPVMVSQRERRERRARRTSEVPVRQIN
jgi:polyferredoxin